MHLDGTPPKIWTTEGRAVGRQVSVTLPELAESLGAPERALRDLIRQGRLAVRDGGLLIPEQVLSSSEARLKWAAGYDPPSTSPPSASTWSLTKWVALDDAITAAQKELGADPQFIRLILAWDGVLYDETMPFMPESCPRHI